MAPIPEMDTIWMDGALVPWADAKVHVLTHALHYGSGVFEGIRAYKTERGVAVLRLTEHLKRIERSAKLYYMPVPYTVEELYDATFEVLESNKLDACYIRPLVFRGYGEMGLFPMDAPVQVIIAAWPWGTYLGDEGVKHGVRAKTSSIQSLDHTALARAAKATGQYLNSILAKIEVLNAGYDEAVMLTEHGHVAEGSGENIFVVRNGVLMTPPPSDGVLEGITRDIVMNAGGERGHRAAGAQPVAQRPRDRRRAVLHRHRGRGRADPRGRRPPHRRARPGDAPHAGALRGHHRGQGRGVRRLHGVRRGSSDPAGVRGGPDEPEQHVQLYDTTLRDGMQQEGMSVSVDEKVRIALKLDELGIGFIEGGFPASNPKEIEFFRRMRDERLGNAELVAFGMTRRKGAPAEADESLRVLAEIFTPTVAIVGKTWGLHLSKVLRVSRDENLRMIDDSVRFLAAQGKRVVYDAEHFFDAWRDDREYALRCVTAAAEAGAAVVCLCDTNGASLPPFVADVVREVTAALPGVAGRHPRAQRQRLAVASSLVAVEAGARQVQGTINGYGERCGNANLVSIIPALKLKMGYDVRQRRAARAPHRDLALRRRRGQRGRVDPRALRRPLRLRPQGRHARRRRREGARDLRARRPREGRQRAAHRDLGALRQGRRAAQGAGARPPARGRRRARRRGAQAPQGARARGLPLRGRRRLVRPPAAPGAGAARAAVPPRELPRDRREARGRQGGRSRRRSRSTWAASASSAPPRATAP